MAADHDSGVYWGETRLCAPAAGGTGGFVERDGEPLYRIHNYSAMPPFFMTVVSGYDHWMFVSSSGGLTCGRRSPDHALFPYTTDDKIHDADATTGPQTLLLVGDTARRQLWMPFVRGLPVHQIERNLYRNLAGSRLLFEEINHSLDLVFSYSWSTGDRFGFIRSCALENRGANDLRVEVLDGLRNLLPYGVNRGMQATMSTLVDAYKQAETQPELNAAVYSLSSIPSDRAEPSEALAASVAWSVGLERPKLLLSEDQVPAFCAGLPVEPESCTRGRRGAFFVQGGFRLRRSERREWYLVADVMQGPTRLPRLFARLRQGVAPAELEQDMADNVRQLLRLAGAADGCQLSADRLTTSRHLSNTVFNIMRGGVFVDGYRLPVTDFLDFVAHWNQPLLEPLRERLAGGPGRITLAELAALAGDSGDPDLERLVLEYLPLTFSRRHGDPSRPWNEFSIDIRSEDGSERLQYQGNWRDIFQNWEALAISYPGFIESFVTRFVNASTADGYNPYRLSRDGFEWEELDSRDPWSNIGYWGDHQVNYLGQFLQLSQRYHPGRLAALLDRALFVYADVPYRIARYADLLRDPRASISYDDAAAAAIAARVARLGSDGKRVHLADGSLHRVSLLEKLLVPALVKIGNFVPGGGIWMNTQRPEWNDANNALVGYGLSVVTLCYLRRYLVLLDGLLATAGTASWRVSAELWEFLGAAQDILRQHRALLQATVNDGSRKAFMDAMGRAAEDFRARVYSGFSGRREDLGVSELRDFVGLALEYLDHSIAGSRREDGLFHAYRLIRFGRDGYAVDDLDEMLEGQVAVLNSGYLGDGDALALLEALRASALYREDCGSYLLYPDSPTRPFRDRNRIPQELLADNPWMLGELAAGASSYLVADVDGTAHFRPRFRNAGELRQVLAADPAVRPADAAALCEVYEAVFRHRRFTGRSGRMFKYEGLGCIYWHMVSKLSLAAAEAADRALRRGVDTAVAVALFEHYRQIRAGLGVHRAPSEYGAFPIDPYSHTPAFAGVQQPGMTGQVKEDFIRRLLELGVRVEDGVVCFEPVLLQRDEFLAAAAEWVCVVAGVERREEVPAGTLAFTLCGVPVLYRIAAAPGIRVYGPAGDCEELPGSRLSDAWSEALFRRGGGIARIEVAIDPAHLR